MADTENGAMVMAVLAVLVLLACRVRELWGWCGWRVGWLVLIWLSWMGWWGLILGSTNEKRRVRGHVFFSVSESGAYQAALIPR